MNERTAQPQFLFHAPGELAGGPLQKGVQAGAACEFVNAAAALGSIVAEQAREELQVFFHRERGVQVLAQPLRHIGDPGTYVLAVPAQGHVTPQHLDPALLHRTGPRHQCQQAGLAHAIRTDEPHHAPGGKVQGHGIQRRVLPVTQRHPGKARHGWGGLPLGH